MCILLSPLRCRELRPSLPWLAAIPLTFALACTVQGQTAATGALRGVTLDPSGAVLSGVTIHLRRDEGGETRSTTSDEAGRFGFPLLSPGSYELQANKSDFSPLSLAGLHVSITETVRLALHFELAIRVEQAMVSSTPMMVQLDTSALGRIVSEDTLTACALASPGQRSESAPR